jgi:vacuolar protein sorting-associated protein IST1
MFNPTRAKVQLKLSVNRLQMLQNKKNMLAQQQRKEIARLLEIGKEESARIRVCGTQHFIWRLKWMDCWISSLT